jgi:hypothetical protein
VIRLMGDSSPRFHALFLAARFTVHVSASATHSMYIAKFGFVLRHSLLSRSESRDYSIQFLYKIKCDVQQHHDDSGTRDKSSFNDADRNPRPHLSL